jgi:hypothetical protein
MKTISLLIASVGGLITQHSVAQSYALAIPTSAVLPPALIANHCYTSLESPLATAVVRSEIHIHSIADVQRLRSKLIDEIWPGGFPVGSLPVDVVETTSKRPAGASGLFQYLSTSADANLRAEYRLTIDLGFGLRSVIYLWVPNAENNRLFIVHEGHADDTFDSHGKVSVRATVNTTNLVTVAALLRGGFTTMWIQMPLYGDNISASSREEPSFSQCLAACDRHAQIFRFSKEMGVSPYRFFIEPVVIAINYAVAKHMYAEISMMGASGGGWATLLAAAIDTRIANSASVAASLPLDLRTGKCGEASAGDVEQKSQSGSLYKDISYLDLYIMAATGLKRQHMQINNQFDSCCFFGVTFLTYAAYVSDLTAGNNLGNYKYYLDSSFLGHGYNISLAGKAANRTLEDIVLPSIAKNPQ